MEMMKLYWRCVRTQMRTIIMYMIIFITIFVILAFYSKEDSGNTAFQETKADISIIDHDQSELSKALSDYLAEKANVVTLENDDSALQDALFYDHINVAIIIPEGFEADFESGKSELIENKSKQDNMAASMVDQYVNAYLQKASAFKTAFPDKSMNEIHEKISALLKQSINVHMQANESGSKTLSLRNSYYNYYSYVTTCLLLSCLGTAMITIFGFDVHRRTIVSPIKNTSLNLQLLASNILFSSIIWLVFTTVIILLSKEIMLTQSGLLYLINSYVFTLVITSMAYLISCILSNRKHSADALNGISNVLGLSFSFLCGAFVPQAMISSGILQVASFLPTFWFIKNNDLLSVDKVSSSLFQEVGKGIGIQALFGIAFILIAVYIMRNKRNQEVLISTKEAKR